MESEPHHLLAQNRRVLWVVVFIPAGCPKVLRQLFDAKGEEISGYKYTNFVTTKHEEALMAGGQETDMRNHHSHYFN